MMNYYELAAIVAHEVNKAYCESIGDHSQPSWADAPDWQKESAIQGMKAHREKSLTPEQSHQAWYDHKKAEGWVYGEVKDPEKKTHPCMVPYDELPEEHKVKDYLFRGVFTGAFTHYNLHNDLEAKLKKFTIDGLWQQFVDRMKALQHCHVAEVYVNKDRFNKWPDQIEGIKIKKSNKVRGIAVTKAGSYPFIGHDMYIYSFLSLTWLIGDCMNDVEGKIDIDPVSGEYRFPSYKSVP